MLQKLTFFKTVIKPASVFLFSRPSICSSKRHLLGQWDVCEFRVGSPSGYWRSQRPEVQRVVSEMLRGGKAL